jgi:pimeloyl-ACP methyl ester carboxylesterase
MTGPGSRPSAPAADANPLPGAAVPSFVRSLDGTPIAVFRSGEGPPLVLVHGAAADHTTFRVVGPMLAERFTVHALDRRGRGASADGPAYSIEREFEDIAAVVDAAAAEHGAPVDLVGHSFGGRCGLGAALLTGNLRRLVVYEGAPPPPGRGYQRAELRERLGHLAEAGDREAVLVLFMREIVGMSDADLAAYRANPVWPLRVQAASTIVRELGGERSAAASLEALGLVRQPVLQLLGSESRAIFHESTAALQGRLLDGRIVVIEGARHAAHHTHPDRFVEAVEAFITERSA